MVHVAVQKEIGGDKDNGLIHTEEKVHLSAADQHVVMGWNNRDILGGIG